MANDPAHGLVKIKGPAGEQVVPVDKLQIGNAAPAGPAPAGKPAAQPEQAQAPQAPTSAEPAPGRSTSDTSSRTSGDTSSAAGGDTTSKPAPIAAEPITAPPPAKPDEPMYEPDPTADSTGDGVADASRVGVPAHLLPPPPPIGRLPRLTDTERKVESSFAEAFQADPEKMVDDYITKKNHQVGSDKKGNPVYEIGDAPNIFNTDDCKMLSATYNPPKDAGKSPEEVLDNRSQYNTVLHQTANAIAKRAFVKYLDEEFPKLPPEKRTVLVTSGGVAAGKGYALGRVDQVKRVADQAGAVWDAAGEQNSTENPWILKECEKRGIKATFLYVHSDPSKTWENPQRGVVERAGKIGRMVDARLFADSYTLGARNFHAFHQGHKDKANFFILDNTDEGKDENGNPRVLDQVPQAALQADPEQLHERCVNYLQTSETVKPAVKRGGTNGLRIWGGPGDAPKAAGGKPDASATKPTEAPKPGTRANQAISKYQELIAQAKQTRIDAFNAAKADATKAKATHDEHFAKVQGAYYEIVPAAEGSRLSKAISQVEDLALEEYDAPAEQFNHLKAIEKAATHALALNKLQRDLSAEEVASNQKHLTVMIENARAAREHLKACVAHRKDMKAIKSGEPLDVQESMVDADDDRDLAWLLGSMEADGVGDHEQPSDWLGFAVEESWFEVSLCS